LATPARQVAFRVLVEIERGRATLADLMASPEAEALAPRDRSLLHELVLGTLRLRGRLDHAIAAQLDRPLELVDRDVLTALRLGAHQILDLRVPDRAAVSESVDLVREVNPRAAGFANAVLRRLAREGSPPFPNATRDSLGWLTTAGSLPRWLAERWLERLGARKAIARATALLSPPPTVFRLNPRVPGARERAATLGPRALAVPGAWEATSGRAAELASEGAIYLQDEGSQLIAHLAAASGRVLDACAAPGGKTTLAADLASDGLVVACEPAGRRLTTLRTLVVRWGCPNVRVVGADALHPPFARASFDSVLLDAPCSGLGTLARHPDIRWRATAADLLRHAGRQAELLASVALLVKPGGRLVYATCSSEPEENEDIVSAFLARNERFRVEGLPGWAAPFVDGAFARTGSGAADAFFAAVLRLA
jgi:16S rRNA (cytosine967-C5)-methyltransferase